jgi:hypothetical protein
MVDAQTESCGPDLSKHSSHVLRKHVKTARQPNAKGRYKPANPSIRAYGFLRSARETAQTVKSWQRSQSKRGGWLQEQNESK